jgi:DtxR family Mn-dependent transcriptional regulator
MKTLSSLKMNQKAVVIGISKQCEKNQRRRLMDLGIIPGSVISVQLTGNKSGPVAYKVKEAVIALRKHQTDQIFIE